MASKAELEKMVADLSKEIAELRANTSAPVVSDNIVSATITVPAGISEEELQKRIDLIKEQFQAELKESRDALLELDRQANKQIREANDQFARVLNEKNELVRELSSQSDNSVTIDGKTYPIVYRTIARQLIDDVKKRYVDENFTVVVIEKHGG